VTGPRRRINDHLHPEYWTELDQHRYEDRLANEVKGIKDEVGKLNQRITLIMGAVALMAFLLPVAAPFIRGLLGF
jgi:hypothetical protein